MVFRPFTRHYYLQAQTVVYMIQTLLTAGAFVVDSAAVVAVMAVVLWGTGLDQASTYLCLQNGCYHIDLFLCVSKHSFSFFSCPAVL